MFQFVPVFDEDGAIVLYDIYVQDATGTDVDWHGSRHTREQCDLYLSQRT